MANAAPGIFFDGKTSVRHAVTVELDPTALLVRGDGGQLLARWPYEELQQLASRDGILRLGRARNRDLARLEVRDPAFAAAIDELSGPVDRTGAMERRNRQRVVIWSIVAVISLLVVGIFGVPAVAGRLAPFVPYAVERKMGEAVDQQVRAILGSDEPGKPFECGAGDEEKAGRAALDRVLDRLAPAAGLPMPLNVTVIRRKEANAVALPGGHIYLFQGLIAKSQSADEVAGVIAHEMGHVAHRDGTRSVLQAAGLSFVFGMVLGDFVGGGAVILAARTILQLSYSRDVETAADLYAVELMSKVGGDGRALATILDRIAGAIEPGVKILLNHPETKERVALIMRAAASGSHAPLLAPVEWAALKRICG